MSGQSILFDIIARDKASATFSKVGNSAGKTESQLGKFGKTAGKLAGLVGVAGFGAGLVSFLKDSNAEAREAQKVGALTTQVIKSTGGAAHVTAQQVGSLAMAISNKVGVDDEAIQSGANMLLTFKNIRNEAGKNNKIFDQAVQTTTDLAAAMAAASGGQLNFRTASIQVGKALNDPIKGVTALAKVGVTFTDQQKKQIKALVDSGQRMKAQKIILGELTSEFGGAAAAQATAGDKARVAWKNLEEQIGTALLPTVDKLANLVGNDVVPAVSKFVTQMQDGTGAGGEFAGVLHTIYEDGKHVLDFVNGIPGPVKKYGAEVLIAAVALNKLNNSLGSSTTGLRGFVNGLGPAERGMTRTEVGAYNLGVAMRALAGAGGMLAVADGAKRGSSALGALEVTAGAAATGFAVGGPLGAGIGAAAGGLYELTKYAIGSDKAMKDSIPTNKQFAGTLDGVAAATTRATRALVYESLQKSGLLKQTQALNISDRDATQAAMGNEAARRRVSAALAEATARGKNYQALKVAQKLGVETSALYSSRIAQLQKNLALAATKQEAQKIQAKLDRLARTNATANVSISGADTAISKLNAVLTLMHQIGSTRGGNAQLPKPGSLLGQLSGRAAGGPVSAGVPYIVGERRPELFVPNQSGRIIPTVPTGSMSGVDSEQSLYRALVRALSDTSTVITNKPNLDALDLLVGT